MLKRHFDEQKIVTFGLRKFPRDKNSEIQKSLRNGTRIYYDKNGNRYYKKSGEKIYIDGEKTIKNGEKHE